MNTSHESAPAAARPRRWTLLLLALVLATGLAHAQQPPPDPPPPPPGWDQGGDDDPPYEGDNDWGYDGDSDFDCGDFDEYDADCLFGDVDPTNVDKLLEGVDIANNKEDLIPDPDVPRGTEDVDQIAGKIGRVLDELENALAEVDLDNPFKDAQNDAGTGGGIGGDFPLDGITFMKGEARHCRPSWIFANCCRSDTPSADASALFFNLMGKMLRKSAASAAQCAIEQMSPETMVGTTELLNNGVTLDANAFQNAMTGIVQRTTGGGDAPQCGEPVRMEDVRDEFVEQARERFSGWSKYVCNSAEQDFLNEVAAGGCELVGDYCSLSVLGKCLQKRRSYCCFHSPMNRMLRMQLMAQLGGNLGSPKNPDCGGVSLADLMQVNVNAIDTEDLEGRMLAGDLYGTIADLYGGDGDPEAFFERITGSGSSVNSGRVDAMSRAITQFSGFDPDAAFEGTVDTMDGVGLGGDFTEPTVALAGEVSFLNGYRAVRLNGAQDKKIPVAVLRYGTAGGVSVSVVDTGEGTAVPATMEPIGGGNWAMSGDYAFAQGTVGWQTNDDETREMILTVYRSSRTDPRTVRLRLESPAGGIAIGAHGEMTIEIMD